MKRRASVIACLLMIAVTVVNLAYVIKDSFFYDLDNLPTGTFVREDFDQSILFSTGYKLKVYQIDESSHFPAGIRVELCNDHTGNKRTIYWQTGTKGSIVNWLETEPAVTINGVYLNYETDSYDCRDFDDHIFIDNYGNKIVAEE